MMDAPDYRRIFESAPVLALVLDRELHIVAASDAFLAATLTTREAVIGEPVFGVFPSDPEHPELSGEAAVRGLLGRVLREGTVQHLAQQRYDVPRPASAGGGFERRYWNAVFAPLPGPGGEVSHIVCTTDDVTERALEARLRQLWGVDALGVLFFDQAGTLISANDTLLRWTGDSAEDVATGHPRRR